MERYQSEVTQMANSDPELKALLDGKPETEIKVKDKEIFELKKAWVKDYLTALKAEQVKISLIFQLFSKILFLSIF